LVFLLVTTLTLIVCFVFLARSLKHNCRAGQLHPCAVLLSYIYTAKQLGMAMNIAAVLRVGSKKESIAPVVLFAITTPPLFGSGSRSFITSELEST